MDAGIANRSNFTRVLDLAGGVLFWLTMVAAVRYQLRLLKFLEWGDESETIVTAKMMAAGSRLYSEVFNHHGPLAFLPGYVLEHFGDFGVPGHRVPVMLLQWAAWFAIYRSPVLQQVAARRIATIVAAVFTVLVLPPIWGHADLYQAYAGALLVIILAQYTLPAIIDPAGVERRQIYLGNVLLACVPFLAVSYGPVTLALYLASIRPRWFKQSLIGLAVGGVLNLAFILLAGSLVGYAVVHFYINLEILPKVMRAPSALAFLMSGLEKLVLGNAEPIMSAGAIGLVVSSLLLAWREPGRPWRSGLVFLGLASLMLRGWSFQALPLFYSAATAPIILLQYGRHRRLLGGLFVVAIALGLWSLIAMNGGPIKRTRMGQIPKDTEFSRLAAKITQPGDRIIAYTFRNFDYIAAHRLPASGYFFYLPAQAIYNREPVMGIDIDPCAQIESNRPKVMLIDKWTVWGVYPWDAYAGCLNGVISRNYTPIEGTPYYIRNDIAQNKPLMQSLEAEYGHRGAPGS